MCVCVQNYKAGQDGSFYRQVNGVPAPKTFLVKYLVYGKCLLNGKNTIYVAKMMICGEIHNIFRTVL